MSTNPHRIDFKLRRTNRALRTEDLLQLLQSDAPAFFARAEVVGRWVWLTFPTKQPRDVTGALSELGFHWNRRRQTWQHPCGVYCDRATRHDPRQKYGRRPAGKEVAR
jgi:hypothetical protein